MNVNRLKYSELKAEREIQHKCQHGVCPLCLAEIKLADSALDHDHTSGRVRAVLHPECNILLGKIENYLQRWSRGLDDGTRLFNFLANAYAYMGASYAHNPFHPRYLTTDQKEIKRLTKIMRRSKKPETKAKYKKLIENLK